MCEGQAASVERKPYVISQFVQKRQNINFLKVCNAPHEIWSIQNTFYIRQGELHATTLTRQFKRENDSNQFKLTHNKGIISPTVIQSINVLL